MVLHLKRQRIFKQMGTTLIEVLMALVIMTLLLAMVGDVQLLSTRIYKQDSGWQESNRASNAAALYIRRDLRNAHQIVASYGSYSTSSSTVVISVPSSTTGGVVAGSYDTIIYRRDDLNRLLRSVYPSNVSSRAAELNRVIAKSVTSLSFTYNAHDFKIGDGTTKVFTLTGSWYSTPTCRVNGAFTTGLSYNANTKSATFGFAPSLGNAVEFIYVVDPSVSASLPSVTEVSFALQANSTSAEGTITNVNGSGRLRNK